MIKPEDCTNIHDVRQNIDVLDKQIMELFALRKGFVERIVDFKEDEEAIIAKERQDEVYNKCRNNAQNLGLNPDLFENIYKSLINYNIQEEIKLFNAHSKIK